MLFNGCQSHLVYSSLCRSARRRTHPRPRLHETPLPDVRGAARTHQRQHQLVHQHRGRTREGFIIHFQTVFPSRFLCFLSLSSQVCKIFFLIFDFAMFFVLKEFEELWPKLAVVVDGGPIGSKNRLGSTVVDLSVLGKYRIIRPGW